MRVFLDTHAFVALGEGRADRFGRASRRLLTTSDLCLSPAVLLELHFLREIGRLMVEPDGFHEEVASACDVEVTSDSFRDVIRRATPLSWTRDPFDRLIVATAVLHGARLITKDTTIQEHFEGAVW